MKGKKTISVEALIDYSNIQLANKDKHITAEYLEGVISTVQHFLHASGNYNGFMFIDNNDCEIGTIGHLRRKYFKPNGK